MKGRRCTHANYSNRLRDLQRRNFEAMGITMDVTRGQWRGLGQTVYQHVPLTASPAHLCAIRNATVAQNTLCLYFHDACTKLKCMWNILFVWKKITTIKVIHPITGKFHLCNNLIWKIEYKRSCYECGIGHKYCWFDINILMNISLNLCAWMSIEKPIKILHSEDV